MMQRSRRTAVYAVVTGLLTAGTLTATMTTAHANVAGFCNGSGTAANCKVTETITAPTSVTVAATATVNGTATVSWSATCTPTSGSAAATSGGTAGTTPLSVPLVLAFAAPASCNVSATVSLPSTDATNTLNVAMTYTTAASASPSPSPTSTSPATSGYEIKGYDGKCLDAAGNSSANRTKVQIWTCGNDRAQKWTYSNGELIHNGACANDQRSGGSGSKVIMYTCNHAKNELWTDLANGELVNNAQGYKLCLDDPAYSTRNGTQLIVYTCHNSSNQHWKVP
jgi:hypothetical protein